MEAASLSPELWGSGSSRGLTARRKNGALIKGFLRDAPPSQPASPASLLLEVFGVAPSPVNHSVICAVLALERWDQVPLDGPTAGGSACRGTHPVVPLQGSMSAGRAHSCPKRPNPTSWRDAGSGPPIGLRASVHRAMREIGRYGRQHSARPSNPRAGGSNPPGRMEEEAHAHFSVPGAAGHGDMGEEMAAPAARVAPRS